MKARSSRTGGTNNTINKRDAAEANALTCASWDYPLGTLLLVTERQSKRSVLVEVTDRGPAKRLHRKGRRLDLSRGAFSRIGDLSNGLLAVTYVRVGTAK